MPKRYQPLQYKKMLERALANVEENIRIQHARSKTIGLQGRQSRRQLLESLRPSPRLPEFDLEDLEDIEDIP